MQEANNILNPNRSGIAENTGSIEDYAELLDRFGLIYKKVDYYWQVKEVTKVQGWIIHISIIALQIPDTLQAIIPLLKEENISFKVARNKRTARSLLDGNLGYEQIGKVISIYTSSDIEALQLSQKLVALTLHFKGPDIPTDIYLGGRVYVRYGGINPIIIPGPNGREDSYIYDHTGKLIKDPYSIPFQLPKGVSWPFTTLASPNVPSNKKNLNNIYRPVDTLKSDARGNVFKGIYLKNLFQVKSCVIKAGKKNMLADDYGRDIQERLIWQQKLQNKLSGIIPLPKIIDVFKENGDMYLVMEYIKGASLYDRIKDINSEYKTWFQISLQDQNIILDYLLRIVSIIEQLHQNGYVHRDIAPGNFLIDLQNEIVLIDTELAYDLNENKTDMPFELGTPGFMSPEQEAVSIPTFKEDVYGLGGLMINTLTGLSPVKFNTKEQEILAGNLVFFIDHPGIVNLISRCLNHTPEQRPELSVIRKNLENYKLEINATPKSYQSTLSKKTIIAQPLDKIIQSALDGLSKPPMPISEGRWMSKTIKEGIQIDTRQKDYSPYPGLHTGMAGVLYLLARAKGMGYSIEGTLKEYYASWKFIDKYSLNSNSQIKPGLYNGSAGIALALSEGIRHGLLENTEINRNHIKSSLNLANLNPDYSEGICGQGISLMQCKEYLDKDFVHQQLEKIITQLFNSQKKDGSWAILSDVHKKKLKMNLSFTHGITGIIWFLVDYIHKCTNDTLKSRTQMILDNLFRTTNNLQDLLNFRKHSKVISNEKTIGDEMTGMINCSIKCYEVLQHPQFKSIAENALHQYPSFAVNNNFSQDGGMAGLGELYLEAWRVFRNEEWKERAVHIANVFAHTLYHGENGSCYWLMEEINRPVADLLTGNSGIIHFLMRCYNPEKLGHIILK